VDPKLLFTNLDPDPDPTWGVITDLDISWRVITDPDQDLSWRVISDSDLDPTSQVVSDLHPDSGSLSNFNIFREVLRDEIFVFKIEMYLT